MKGNSLHEDYPFQKYLRTNLNFPKRGTLGYVYVKVDVLEDSTVALEFLKGYGESKDEVFRVLKACPKELIGHYKNMDFILPVLFADTVEDCYYFSFYRYYNDIWILPVTIILGGEWFEK